VSARIQTFDVPVIDFGPVLTGELRTLELVAEQVNKACREVGFFYIANAPVPAGLRHAVLEQSRSFFALPLADKLSVSMERSHDFRGYIPIDAKLVASNRRGQGGAGFQLHLADDIIDQHPPDSSESFQIHRELTTDDPDVAAGKPLHGPNQWPPAAPSLKPVLLEYFNVLRDFSRYVLEVFAIGLGLERDYFARFYTKPLMQLRLMHYPSHPVASRVPYGVRPHCDAGAFSMLMQDGTGGLEIEDLAGNWQFVPPLENTLVVNIGDTLKLWSNNRFRSTRHRVLNTSGASRYSVPFFANPDFDAIITPLESCVDAEHPPVFDVLQCGESLLHTYSRIWPSSPKE